MTAGRIDQTNVANVLRDHRIRIRNLEAVPATPGTAPRMSWGCVYNDGGTDEPGSNDWSAVWDSANGYTITITPGFVAAIKTVLLTPSNNNPPSGLPPQPYFAVANANAALLDTFYVYTFDASGSPADGGFAFLAIDQAP